MVSNSNIDFNPDDVSFDILYFDFAYESGPKVVHMFSLQHAQMYLQNFGVLALLPSEYIQGSSYQNDAGSSLVITRLSTNERVDAPL